MNEPHATAAARPRGASTGERDHGTLLVVDDNEMNRDMLSRRLERRGYTVETAIDGARALECIDAKSYDLVLLDIAMPEVDGLTVLERVRATRSLDELPIIMATAFDRSEDVVKALELGANDYVTKPLDFPVVLARVRTQLALKRARQELEAAHARMKRELDAASKVQRTLIPTSAPAADGVRFAWTFEPCDELAGDTLDVFRIDERRIGLYLLDVSGHGVPAALLAVTLSRVLSHMDDASLGRDGSGIDPSPAAVANMLNHSFPMDPVTKQYFTLVYGVLDLEQRTLGYVCGGHPPPVRIVRDREPELCEAGGLPLGCFPTFRYEACSIPLAPGDRLYFYSDGLIEAKSPGDEMFGPERLAHALAAARSHSLDTSLSAAIAEVKAWCGGQRFDDDVSMLALEIE